jgi:hypothetical protein
VKNFDVENNCFTSIDDFELECKNKDLLMEDDCLTDEDPYIAIIGDKNCS